MAKRCTHVLADRLAGPIPARLDAGLAADRMRHLPAVAGASP